jgi:hypothetical protein
MPEQLVLVPRRGRTPKQAYEVAVVKLVDDGYTPIRLNSYTIDRDKVSGAETFMIRVEIEAPRS